MSESSRDVLVTFKVEGVDDEFHVLEFQGEEHVSQFFQFNLVLGSTSSDVDFAKVVGQPAVLTLKNKQGTRYFNGVTARFVQQEKARRFTVYHLTLVPKTWRMYHRHDCRIFQKKHIKKIISEELLKKAKIEHKFGTKGGKDPVEREYCVQYRESDWSFIARLLEEEGFFYFFEHKADKHVLHIGNDYQLHPDISGADTTLEFHAPATTTPDKEHIYSLQYGEEVRSGKVTLNEWNFEKPTLKYKKDGKDKLDNDLEVYDYPGLYAMPETGGDLAKVRMQELQVQRRVVEGESDCIRFCAGYSFTLDKYHRKALNKKKYMLVRVSHFGEKHQDLEAGAVSERIRYHNAFQCIQRDVPFRPPRVTPKPQVTGCQTAIVTGPSNEEIYTDKHGRVKVHFHWDRLGKKDENSSCWIRVSQLWAGQSWGAMWIPRKGQEVIVEFLEGDPDRPIVTGRVYHAQNPPPYTLPAEKTKSTIKSNSSKGGGGSNEIRFEDKKGSEEIYTHAQKDQNEKVENNMSTTVGNDQSISVGHDRSVTTENDETITISKGKRVRTVKTGTDEVKVETATRTVTVKGDSTLNVTSGGRLVKVDTKGYTLAVKNGHTITVSTGGSSTTVSGGDHSITIGAGSSTISASNGLTLTTPKNLTAIGNVKASVSGDKVSITGKTEVTIGVGSSSITLNAQGVSIGGAKISSTAVGVHEISGALIKIN